MRTHSIALTAVAALAVLMAGCGKVPGAYDGGLQEEEIVSNLPPGLVTTVSKDKARPTPTPAVGVLVDGRFYPKGEAPTVSATPSPDAPQAGKGHLHLTVSLANRSSGFVDHLDLSVVTKEGNSPVFTRRILKNELVGTKLSVTVTNQNPGNYAVELHAVTANGGTLTRASADAKVEADKTTEAKI